MQNDANISTTLQKIIIKLTKNEFSKEIKEFLVKRDFTANEDILAIKKILDDKSKLITLSSDTTGNINNNLINKNRIKTKIKKLIDPSNTSGDSNHLSLRGTTITIKRGIWTRELISTSFRPFRIIISKSG